MFLGTGNRNGYNRITSGASHLSFGHQTAAVRDPALVSVDWQTVGWSYRSVDFRTSRWEEVFSIPYANSRNNEGVESGRIGSIDNQNKQEATFVLFGDHSLVWFNEGIWVRRRPSTQNDKGMGRAGEVVEWVAWILRLCKIVESVRAAQPATKFSSAYGSATPIPLQTAVKRYQGLEAVYQLI